MRQMPVGGALARASSNGVFGIKAHFHHFDAAMRQSELVRHHFSHARYLYLNRNDKIAAAVSMAKALQSNAWMSFSTPRKAPLFYSRELISECLRELTAQTEDWWGWFDANGIEPYIVNYEEMVADIPATVTKIAQWLDVDVDAGTKVLLPSSGTSVRRCKSTVD